MSVSVRPVVPHDPQFSTPPPFLSRSHRPITVASSLPTAVHQLFFRTRAPSLLPTTTTTKFHPTTHPAVGAAVATNLLRNDVPLVLYDLQGDANVPAPLREKLAGATWAASAAEAAAGSEVVITALPKPEHVSAAFESPGGILEGLQAGTTWIEHSTTDFVNTERVRSLVEAKGAHAVEAPLTGGMQILRAGKMVTLVGADPAVFEGDIASLVVRRGARRAAAVCVSVCVSVILGWSGYYAVFVWSCGRVYACFCVSAERVDMCLGVDYCVSACLSINMMILLSLPSRLLIHPCALSSPSGPLSAAHRAVWRVRSCDDH